jgi:hypothetical protein
LFLAIPYHIKTLAILGATAPVAVLVKKVSKNPLTPVSTFRQKRRKTKLSANLKKKWAS